MDSFICFSFSSCKILQQGNLFLRARYLQEGYSIPFFFFKVREGMTSLVPNLSILEIVLTYDVRY